MTEDYGRRDWELPCVCGHLKERHINRSCLACWDTQEMFSIRLQKARHLFKLDNLAYVEQVARAKGLV
jgi:hypothetical protein